MGGGLRAFFRRGKFVHSHSEMDAFLAGRMARDEGMRRIADALAPSVNSPERLRKKTLEDLRAWDLVYLDYIAAGRLVPGEPTAAAEPLHGIGPNEALLIRHADSKRLIKQLPPVVQRSLKARLKKLEAVWQHDAKEYDRLFKPAPTPKAAKKVAKKPRKITKKKKTFKPKKKRRAAKR